MKKLLLLIILSASPFGFAQKANAAVSSPTVEQVAATKDVKMIAAFIKQNPTHPRTEEFKRKLVVLLGGGVGDPAAKPVITPLKKENLEKAINKDIAENGSNDRHKAAANILTHLMNDDPSSKQAYVQIVNRSKCSIVIKFSGKKFYNLSVPASGQNFLMVDKGNYTLTTNVCDAKYYSVKNINKNLSLALNNK